MKKLIAFIGTLSIIVTLSIILQVKTLTLFDTVERLEPEVIDTIPLEIGEMTIIKTPKGDVVEFIEFYPISHLFPGLDMWESISMN